MVTNYENWIRSRSALGNYRFYVHTHPSSNVFCSLRVFKDTQIDKKKSLFASKESVHDAEGKTENAKYGIVLENTDTGAQVSFAIATHVLPENPFFSTLIWCMILESLLVSAIYPSLDDMPRNLEVGGVSHATCRTLANRLAAVLSPQLFEAVVQGKIVLEKSDSILVRRKSDGKQIPVRLPVGLVSEIFGKSHSRDKNFKIDKSISNEGSLYSLILLSAFGLTSAIEVDKNPYPVHIPKTLYDWLSQTDEIAAAIEKTPEKAISLQNVCENER